MSTKFTYKKHNAHDSICYRNGEPIMVAMRCPEPDHELKNVIILKKIKHVDPLDILRKLLEF